jgi:hypothetical protein
MPRTNSKRTRRNKTVRYAVIGLGHIAQAAVLPAFSHGYLSGMKSIPTSNRHL